MSRELDPKFFEEASRAYAGQWLNPTTYNPITKTPRAGKGWVLQSMEQFHFEDEFNAIYNGVGDWLGKKAYDEFKYEASKFFTPYEDGELEHELRTRLGVDINGKPIPGAVGKVQVGSVPVGWTVQKVVYKWRMGKKVQEPNERNPTLLLRTPLYIGETVEQAMERGAAEFAAQGVVVLPLSTFPLSMAVATRISNEAALAACDAIVDRLDEGSGAAILRILDGTQATDPDTAIGAQVTLALLVCSDPAFGNAADANPGGRATANAITQDSSANATGTASWLRGSASNDGATSLDDHIDGSCGTSSADCILNTTAIVSGAIVSISSWTFTVPESA